VFDPRIVRAFSALVTANHTYGPSCTEVLVRAAVLHGVLLATLPQTHASSLDPHT